ncbi:hypothetical protein CONPUDRAFT_169040 [Coniophora puteana RWD-64-598 SS2]|uniref:Zn(2)-C6 fungal-type domain-containing protein n=1 Tax=Coniophora puteana (strain RWD-64-598) TaxID=741705 RepID=A0A5M3MD20_CONPW|nr:uncharacterized protein CONPUDRAFT_169040 [Coniophora puteana RWD-64-598 SS2]EIW76525.1 hypothetical protein CONPUDRAFT_169040 [Coniophora puteana RWD-64-598 SS2]
MPPDIHHYNSKRLPACDACKLRRVKCDPVPTPEACSRCISKGIACTTTPVIRKRAKERSGKRIEAAKATYGAIRPLHEANPAPLIQAENFLVQFELSGELAAHLLELYSKLPRASLVPGAALSERFEANGRRLSLLPRTSQVLALCILTLTSRLSSHPLLFGPGAAPPRLAAFLFDPGSIAMDTVAEWGRRRENACERLREMAVESAWHARLLAGDGGDGSGFGGVSDEGMAACLLLEMIEDRHTPGAGRPWSAAFISLLRRKLEAKRLANWSEEANGDVQDHNDINGYRVMVPTAPSLPAPTPFPFPPPDGATNAPRIQGIGWSVQIMRESLSAAAQGQICSYTLHDEELLVGVKPATPELALAHADTFGIAESDSHRESYEGEGVRVDWWDFGSFYCLVRPFSYRMTEVALDSFGWTSRRAHRAPFDVPKLEKHIESLIPLQNLLQLANKRLKMLLSPAGVEIRRRAGRGAAMDQAVGEQPGDYQRQMGGTDTLYTESMTQGPAGLEDAHSPKDELRAQLTARTFHMLIRGCMGAVNVPVYIDLQERLLAIEQGHGCPGDDKERLEIVLRGVRKALLPHALTLLKGVRSMVHLAWITHIGRSIRVSSSGATDPNAPSKDRDKNSVWNVAELSRRTMSTRSNPPPPVAPTTSSPSESSPASSAESNPSPAAAPAVDPSPLSYAVFPFQQTPDEKRDEIPSVSPQCAPSYPSSFAWEAKVLTLIRMCIAPRVFSRSGGNEPFSFWAQVILDSPTTEEGGTFMTKAEKIAELECSLDVFRVLSWSYPHLSELPLVHKIKSIVESMKGQQNSGSSNANSTSSTSSSSFGSNPLAPPPQNNALFRGVTPHTPLPTLKEALEGVPNERVSEVFFGGAVAGGLGLEGIDEVNDVIKGLAGELNKVFIDAAKLPSGSINSNSPNTTRVGVNGGSNVSASSSDTGGPHTPEIPSTMPSSFTRAAEAFANLQSQDPLLQHHNPTMTGIELSSFVGAALGTTAGLECADAFAKTGHIPDVYGEDAWEAATSSFEGPGLIHTNDFNSFRSAWDYMANQAQEEAGMFGTQNDGLMSMQQDQNMGGSSSAMFMDPMDYAPSMFCKPGSGDGSGPVPDDGAGGITEISTSMPDHDMNGHFQALGEPQMNNVDFENQFQQLFGSDLYPAIAAGHGFQQLLQGLDNTLNDEVNRALRSNGKNGGGQGRGFGP